MHTLVVGAGVVGLTTAHQLAKSGHQVTVIDQHGGPAMGTSASNGAQLSFSYVQPLAHPELLPQMLRMLAGRDIGIRLNLQLDPELVLWCISFLRNCTGKRFSEGKRRLMELALCSQYQMHEYEDSFGNAFDFRRAGKLVLYRGKPTLEDGILCRDAAIDIEPALADFRIPWNYASYAANDAVGDSAKFSSLLHKLLKESGVTFCWKQTMTEVSRSADKVIVTTQQNHFDADCMVLCSGGITRPLAHLLGLPCYTVPMTGYSANLQLTNQPLQHSVTVSDHRIVMTRLGNRMRIAGFADLDRNTGRNARKASLVELTGDIAPHLTQHACPETPVITGQRHMTPTSLPLIGPSKIPGVFTNLGHGMFGWTLAAGSAQRTNAMINSIEF